MASGLVRRGLASRHLDSWLVFCHIRRAGDKESPRALVATTVEQGVRGQQPGFQTTPLRVARDRRVHARHNG